MKAVFLIQAFCGIVIVYRIHAKGQVSGRPGLFDAKSNDPRGDALSLQFGVGGKGVDNHIGTFRQILFPAALMVVALRIGVEHERPDDPPELQSDVL